MLHSTSLDMSIIVVQILSLTYIHAAESHVSRSLNMTRIPIFPPLQCSNAITEPEMHFLINEGESA